MSFEPRDYLRHIVVEADYLIGQTGGLSYEAFVANETLRRAFVRSLEFIGEAAKKVPEALRAQSVDQFLALLQVLNCEVDLVDLR